jgi:hypothetical protein
MTHTAPVPHLSALCRHCTRDIKKVNRPDEVWADAEGFPNCQKDLPHAPLPDGMSGAAHETPADEPPAVYFRDSTPW